MITRITLSLSETQNDALILMARRDYRNPRAQLLFLLEQEAQRRGLLQKLAGQDQETPTTLSNSQEGGRDAANR